VFHGGYIKPNKDNPADRYAPADFSLCEKKGEHAMETKKFIYYQEEDMFVGWFEESPDYRTQGETIEGLKENLMDIYHDLNSGHISCVHRVGELLVA